MSTKEVAIPKETGVSATTSAPRFTPEQIAGANIATQTSLPALTEAQKHFVPLSVEYWSPQVEGEEKFVYVAGIDFHDVPNMETGEINSVECVLLLEQKDDALCRFISASKVLVGNIKDAINRGEIVPMTVLTPVSIKYLGQKKNRSNAKLSNRWQIIPLVISNQ